MMVCSLTRKSAAVHLVLLAGMLLMWNHQDLNQRQILRPLNRAMYLQAYQVTMLLNQPVYLEHHSLLAPGPLTPGLGSHLTTKVKELNVGPIGPGLK
jgi:hypothetical protein